MMDYLLYSRAWQIIMYFSGFNNLAADFSTKCVLSVNVGTQKGGNNNRRSVEVTDTLRKNATVFCLGIFPRLLAPWPWIFSTNLAKKLIDQWFSDFTRVFHDTFIILLIGLRTTCIAHLFVPVDCRTMTSTHSQANFVNNSKEFLYFVHWENWNYDKRRSVVYRYNLLISFSMISFRYL